MSDKPLAARILLIDDDPSIQRAFRRALQDRGHGVVVASSTNEAVAALNRSPFDLCLLDLCLGGESGIELLPRIRELAPWLRVVVVTASSDVQTAISAIRAGAADFLSKPCSPDELMHTVGQQIEAIRMQHRIDQLERDREAANGHEYTSLSPAYRATLEVAHRVAQTDATLLILGENGTGKTQLARAIHRWSQRSQAMFATVSCPSLSAELLASELFGHVRGAFTGATENRQGRVQVAEGGTLFLDEIGDMPAALQPKLLRFLQDREYERVGDPNTRTADVRVIAATNQDLAAMVREGRFREDLFYRLNVITLTLPALRDRRDDIVPIAETELAKLARRYDRPARRFAPAALTALTTHAWPGNLRELHNAVERAVIVSDGEVIGPEHLPFASSRPPPGMGLRAGDAVSLEELERAHIEAIIAASPSLEAAARMLGIDSSTLYRKRKQYSDAA
ncbi:MAG: sigma-54-dependent transcriptional regulator [Sinimarinibacterium flocculans]|uniref:sigma-54-dependent transcriptional regulator n=1 Tax=Sinimarinibacterium flocculans TaxID=985250 RepID=UPI002491C885|nr:sigma-54 dependent transcriptional regulator [Sinimarinibacterium flocculans]MEC9364779.1 sigma-54 dependent transcriptional regulator [Pseudomonadota bacterium]